MDKIDPSSLSDFLKYGPLGLAGLVLVIALLAYSFKTLDQTRVRIIYSILLVGTLFFLVSIGAAYATHAELKASEDVAVAAKNEIEIYKARNARLLKTLASVSTAVGPAIASMQHLNALTGDPQACPGGGHGQGIPHGRDMTILGNEVGGALTSIQQAANLAVNADK